MIRHDGSPAGAESYEMARSAGRAVAMVAALRRLRRRRPFGRAGAPGATGALRLTEGHDRSPEKG